MAIAGLVLAAWLGRERIADNVIADQLSKQGLPATYRIEEIGPEKQVLSHIVIGDPAHPDLTIERAEVAIDYAFGLPSLGQITLMRPRLYGSLHGGRASFGSLDKVLFARSDQPSGLPDIDLKLVDGRALVTSDYGPIGLKADGEGVLADGFTGTLAAIAPQLAGAGCITTRASAYGTVTTGAKRIRFAGPLRLAGLACQEGDLRVANAGYQARLTLGQDLAGLDLEGSLATGPVAGAGVSARRVSGPLAVALGNGRVVSRFELSGTGLAMPHMAARTVVLTGSMRLAKGLTTGDMQADVRGSGLALAGAVQRELAGYQPALEGTLLAPLLARLRGGMARELHDADFAASLTGRINDGRWALNLPQGELRGGGKAVLSLSRVALASDGQTMPQFSGNFRLAGRDLPQITGRMEDAGDGTRQLLVQMDDYAGGASRLRLDRLSIVQQRGGSLAFAGTAEASGPLPGGTAQRLALPIDGTYDARTGLMLWPRCTTVSFRALVLANLQLAGQSMTLCPPPGGAIVRSDARGLRVSAGAGALALRGTLAETPVTLRSGPVGFAWPGTAVAKQIEIALGPPDAPSRFRIANLTARLGEGLGGTFDGADVSLAQVPLDLADSTGQWTYADAVLRLTDGAFTLRDRAPKPRFNPLAANGATLSLADNLITAEVDLHTPHGRREVVQVNLTHDLGRSAGHAVIKVPGLRFDRQLQPGSFACGVGLAANGREGLSCLAYDLAANVNGVVTGTGRIDWTADGVTSSGRFATSDLDLAAAFGPVKGIAGEIVFTDLLGLTTAPGQRLTIASINPGIEAHDGSVTFALADATRLRVSNATFPFLGGTLDMEPVLLDFATPGQRRYVFAMRGIDAAVFVQRMELKNIAASGKFDGTLPLVFDASGNGRIEDGELVSLAPGGNVSYVGALTYEDMGAMANFAFTALRSLDYKRMVVAMNGPLTGEIVTNVRFEGITQGEGATRNFLTRRIARLPIRFNVNIRSSFYDLFRDLRTSYDPAFGADPRTLGLVDSKGRAGRAVCPAAVANPG